MVHQTQQEEDGHRSAPGDNSGAAPGSMEGGSGGHVEVAVPRVLQGGEEAGSGALGSSDEGAPDGTEARDGGGEDRGIEVEDGESIQGEGGVVGSVRPRRKRGRIAAADYARALSLAKGDIKTAAKILGVKREQVSVAINQNAQLRAAFTSDDAVKALSEFEANIRKPSAVDLIPKEHDELAEVIRRQEFDLMRQGLKKAGIKQETLDKLDILDGLAPNSGRFLVASLDLSHKMMVYCNIQLMEQADFIKKTYLEDITLGMEYKIEWQRAYNEICDILGKGYDRTLAGTQAMAKMMQAHQEEKGGGKKKPGFSPLRRVPPAPSANAPKD